MRRLFFLFIIMVFICGCTGMPEKFTSSQDAFQYISDRENGFISDTLLPSQVKINVQVLPSVLIQKTNNPTLIKYFNVQFSYQGNELLAQLPSEDYGTYVQLFSFGMDQKIYLIDKNGKSYYPSMINYQPSYKAGRSNDLLVVFDEELPDDDLKLSIDEFGLNLGRLNFSVNKEQLNYKPFIDKF
ncbi:Uncharacterised protein [Sphingobacterium spiritivorum]|uniref:Uncharacterized protein n=2 Tax=Sphingobacterium spiritivorum TaxID=258 RepID=D7VQF9_SPHSI|nr:hypothetical protein [Sphingobacterium spiritivorum]EFK56010.1 hypothetical protein HMPREF0766_13213 [Sphingobacterium spiritivorum ATCC 33861]QQT35858.1 hypothetical protein I6J01_00085 [Sphingobacterium spiritivorum]SUJ11297.1 Uncharacterised protein [Sphingobacterium spiritivorum]